MDTIYIYIYIHIYIYIYYSARKAKHFGLCARLIVANKKEDAPTPTAPAPVTRSDFMPAPRPLPSAKTSQYRNEPTTV